MRLLITIAMVFLPSSLYAQPAPQASPNEIVLSNRLIQEMQASIACQSATITANKEIEGLKAKIKELEEAAAKGKK